MRGVKNPLFLARAPTRGHPYFGSLLEPSGVNRRPVELVELFLACSIPEVDTVGLPSGIRVIVPSVSSVPLTLDTD